MDQHTPAIAQPLSLSARRSFEAAVHDMGAECRQALAQDSFAVRLRNIAEMATDAERAEAISGFAAAWETARPQDLPRVALQFSELMDQPWFGFRHQCVLMRVVERMGAFAQHHNDRFVIRAVWDATRRNHMDTLEYVFWRGVESVQQTPGATGAPGTAAPATVACLRAA